MSKRNIAITAVVALTLLVGGYWYFFMYSPQKLRQKFDREYSEAQELHHEGKVDESLKAYEEALEVAPSKGWDTQTRLKMAYDLFVRNKGNDREESIRIYKEIIGDTSALLRHRAIAISDLMDRYNGTQDEELARTMIFTGEFAQYLEGGDVELAIRRLYEVADGFYPLSLVDFRIARWYGNALDNKALSEQEKTQYLDQLKQWTAKGESLLPQSLALGYERSKIGYIYQMLALNKADVARYGDKNYKPAEEAFEQALFAIAPEGHEVHTYSIGLYIRFHYAAMLAAVYGEKRGEDIKKILAPVFSVPQQFANYNFAFYEFLKNEMAAEHDIHRHKEDIIRLMNISSEFRAFIQKQGLRF